MWVCTSVCVCVYGVHGCVGMPVCVSECVYVCMCLCVSFSVFQERESQFPCFCLHLFSCFFLTAILFPAQSLLLFHCLCLSPPFLPLPVCLCSSLAVAVSLLVVRLSFSPSLSEPFCPSVCLCLLLSVPLFMHLFICLSPVFAIHPSPMSLYFCLSLSLSLFLSFPLCPLTLSLSLRFSLSVL